MCHVDAATLGRISTVNIYSVAKYYFDAHHWLYRWWDSICTVYILYKTQCFFVHVYIHSCSTSAKTRVCVYMSHCIVRTDTDDYEGLSPRDAIPKCSMTVYIKRARVCVCIYNYCFHPLRSRERRGYCLDFFAMIAMTAIRDKDLLDTVCDARRIKSVDLAIPFLL